MFIYIKVSMWGNMKPLLEAAEETLSGLFSPLPFICSNIWFSPVLFQFSILSTLHHDPLFHRRGKKKKKKAQTAVTDSKSHPVLLTSRNEEEPWRQKHLKPETWFTVEKTSFMFYLTLTTGSAWRREQEPNQTMKHDMTAMSLIQNLF